VRFSVVVPSYGALGDPGALAVCIDAAEALGFEGVWFADHVALPDYATPVLPPPMLDPLAACAWGLGRTRRLRFGTDVLVAPYRPPLVLAALAGSLARLSGERLVVGIGVGYLEGEFAALGLDPADRGPCTDEVLDVLRACWAEAGPVAHPGPRFAFTDVHPVGTPPGGFAPGAVPLWVGGNAGVALRRAARAGDGWHPLFPTPEAYARGRATIEAERARRGRTGPFTWSYSAAATRILDRPAAPSSAPVPPVPEVPPGTAAARARPEFGYAPAPPTAPDGRPRLVGTVEEVVSDVRALAEAGVEHLVLRCWTSASDLDADGVVAQYERIATDVVPAVAGSPTGGNR
jgi:alkanesulfonate monooxygenase SsuD/methylene tetrahydromethanopterin reductase-like flavin-dependent oxidoreductase (luciferase family)